MNTVTCVNGLKGAYAINSTFRGIPVVFRKNSTLTVFSRNMYLVMYR